MATTVNRPRTIKKLEKPRPLKISLHSPTTEQISTVDDIVSLIDSVSMHLNNGFYDSNLQSNIIIMCNHLKLYSHQLEVIYKDQLDRAFIAIRNGSQDLRLDVTTRAHLLELIELRARQWHNCEHANAYYSQKASNLDEQNEMLTPDTPSIGNSSTAPLLLGPGDVIKNSGKFAKPTHIPGKNCCKDEVVIRNSDSGKVNPGAKERLVQITGTSENKITYAKELIKDTIQRNASPVRLEQGGREKNIEGSSSSLNSSASEESHMLQRQHSSLLHTSSTNDASIGEYKYTVIVGPESIKITGTNLDLVRAAKIILEEYFSETPEIHTGTGVEYFTFDEEQFSSAAPPLTPSTPGSAGQSNLFKRDLSFDNFSEKNFSISEKETKKKDISRELTYEILMECAKGPFAKRPPADWDRIQKECPNIIRQVHDSIESDSILTNSNGETNKSRFSSYNCFTNKESHEQYRDEQFEHKAAPKFIPESTIRFNDDTLTRYNNREPTPRFHADVINKNNYEVAASFNGNIAAPFKRELPPRFNREVSYIKSSDREAETFAKQFNRETTYPKNTHSQYYNNNSAFFKRDLPPRFNREVAFNYYECTDQEGKEGETYAKRFNRETTYPKNPYSQYYNNDFYQTQLTNYSDRNNNNFFKTSQKPSEVGCTRPKMSFDMATFNRLCH